MLIGLDIDLYPLVKFMVSVIAGSIHSLFVHSSIAIATSVLFLLLFVIFIRLTSLSLLSLLFLVDLFPISRRFLEFFL